MGRDTPNCPRCHSSRRSRTVAYLLSLELFGEGMPISGFPARPEVTGIGLSDFGFDERLASRLGYRNTFYDAEPRLDITDPPEELDGSLDFLIASEVFEHVPPPVERAFEGAFRLLEPGGLLILTVPFSFEDSTQEHFPNLHEYGIFDFDGGPILVNLTADGKWEVFENLAFHGGRGATLEMRVFSRASVVEHLRAAGFEEIVERQEHCHEFGIVWGNEPSVPFTARRPG